MAVLPTRGPTDPNSSADINSLQTQISALSSSITVTIDGVLITGTNQISLRVPKATTISNVNAKVDTAPAGSTHNYKSDRGSNNIF
jgi:hypothetical protein